jgi:hypothetical protein
LAEPSSLNEVMFWVSHIEVAHSKSQTHPLLRKGAPSRGRSSDRSRIEAQTRAGLLHKQLMEHPEKFAEIARTQSDDPTTARLGGTLGGRTAHWLPAAFLDALATLKEGEISRPVETLEGFHILLLEPAPPLYQVAAQRLIVGHVDSELLERLGTVTTRTRSEARDIAESIANELHTSPELFEEFVRRYSDHPDKANDGDMGTWWSHEMIGESVEGAVLQRLTLGEVSEPLDTALGFEILKRTKPTQRQCLAYRPLLIQFDASLPNAREAARTQASQLVEELRGETEAAFDAAQARFHGAGIEAWPQGRSLPQIEAAVKATPIGGVHAAIEVASSWLLFARVEPSPSHCAPPRVRFSLPQHVTLDLRSVIRRAIAPQLPRVLTELQKALQVALGSSREEQFHIKNIMDELVRACAASADPDARSQALDNAQDELRRHLGKERYALAMIQIERWVAFTLARERVL